MAQSNQGKIKDRIIWLHGFIHGLPVGALIAATVLLVVIYEPV